MSQKLIQTLYFVSLMAVMQSKTFSQEEGMKFWVFGDVPYTNPDQSSQYPKRTFEVKLLEYVYPNIVMDFDDGHLFAVHYGDLRWGSGKCDRTQIKRNLELIAKVFPDATLYTPGDNDWADCDRGGDSELEKLKELREMLSSVDPSPEFQHTYEYRRQEELPENQSWRAGGIEFVTLHIVGSNNGRAEIAQGNVQDILAAVEYRDEFNLRWLKQSFDGAKRQNAKAIVVIIHADVIIPLAQKRAHAGISCSKSDAQKCDGFADFRRHLVGLANSHKELSILLVHGDTSEYCLDQPFLSNAGDTISNLWRFNGPGDFNVSDIAEVTIDPLNADRPFSARGILYNQVVPSICDYQ